MDLATADPIRTLTDLEHRHDELLRQLDDLDGRVLEVLARCGGMSLEDGTPQSIQLN